MAKIDHYSKNNALPGEGTYAGRVAQVVDIGLVDTKFGPSRQARIAIELSEPTRSTGKPVLVNKTIWKPEIAKLSRARQGHLQPRRNKRPGLKELIGCPCKASITHRETESGVFADVEISRYRDAKEPPPLVSDPIFFSLHHSDFNPDVLERLPERLRDKIKAGETYRDLIAQRALERLGIEKPAADPFGDDFPSNL